MRDTLTLMALLEEAKQDLARFKAAGPDPRAVFRSTPGCTIGCGACDIKCAILTGRVCALNDELDDAVMTPALASLGSFHVAYEGNA
ncbi:hypothetical protein HRJ34_25980 [Rhizorhabdus wittichii]|uniref:Uncharacterized protein n=1 Tax=Rhizorhabdus wittichii TaxID=160791 RepID=A0A975D2J1_9SPHN|nr:hypothetical protein [Rhizorhabdus wittichii]QTH21708.1 hypothetical protein HRJ34_25980 [Rhizorhabdus wittichii]